MSCTITQAKRTPTRESPRRSAPTHQNTEHISPPSAFFSRSSPQDKKHCSTWKNTILERIVGAGRMWTCVIQLQQAHTTDQVYNTYRKRDRLALKAQESSEKDEGQRHSKPQQHQDNERAKRHGRRGLPRPRHQIDKEENRKAHARKQECCEQRRLEMIGFFDKLAETRRHVAGGHTHEHKKEERG